MSKTQKHPHASWFSKVSDVILTLPQYVIPQHALSVVMHALTRSQVKWFKNAFIRFITWKFNVNLSEAAVSERAYYASFNAFFTRELRAGIRPIAAGEEVIVSPVDGAISQLGPIVEQSIVQAKGRSYTVEELLGGDKALAEQYQQGQFATIYLSPRDYHRIHMPIAGKLKSMRYVPGKLFSVNPRTARAVPRLFARNERVICVFDTDFGEVTLVLVGAIFVGSMETVWAGQITPPYGKSIQNWTYEGDEALSFEKGQEMGRFNMGSTVVMLLPAGMKPFNQAWQPEEKIQLGQAMN
ncbi:MAG: phosphatidylserine decarboxylase [Methylophaga sp.]|uniref:archaetidylserine decarboxylase n=1 Tax=Methylophaga sp. UBA678 TaxID=1946901 RepID=UPI000C6A744D|nr:archaetidylserine decarboxylase [Methylophaga sp. UBA678]MAX52535.1 phosphatidylserine decarboxylase [Methylophaga sp.]